MADVGCIQAERGYLPFNEGFSKARRDVEKALLYDPTLAQAHATLGHIKTFYDWDWTGADAAYKRALELEPGDAGIVSRAALLPLGLGRIDEAIRLGRRAVELDPLGRSSHFVLGRIALSAGLLDEAEAAFRKVLALNPESPFPGGYFFLGRVHLARSRPEAALQEMELEIEPLFRRAGLAQAYHALGRKKEADAALADLIEKNRKIAAWEIAQVYALRGDAEKVLEWLERAYAQRDPGLGEMKGDPLFKSLEADSRYKAFLQKMRLPQ